MQQLDPRALRSAAGWTSSPRVRELQVSHIEDPFPVCTVVVIHKFLQLHLAVFLFGDISDINTSLWS